MLQIFKNSDERIYAEITKAIEENDGYCCCAVIKDKDTKCICKDFKEQKEEGLCHCGRFCKVEIR